MLRRSAGTRIALAALAVALLACGTQRPTPPVQAALFEDAARIVEPAETTGWFVDRVEIGKLAPAMFQSACQTTVTDREALLSWLSDAIVDAGGPARGAYAKNGGDKGAVKDILFLERVRLLVDHVHTRAEADCPFWLEVDPTFAGVQSDYARFVMLAESRGQLAFNIAGSDLGIGGGGQGRLLFGGGLSYDVTLFAGLELGAAAIFEPKDDGSRELSATVVGGIPLILRLNSFSRFTDIEVALIGLYREDLGRVDGGFRFALTYGTITERIGAFQPAIGFWIGYEIYPATDADPVNHVIALGTRIGLNIDP